MKTIRIDNLKDFSVEALLKSGMSNEDATIITDVLVTTDMFGIDSHGTRNLLNYILKMRAGGLNPKAVPTVEAEGPAWAILNGNAAMGMISGHKAMELAVKKAADTGISYVGVKNSCHFGAAGYYSNLAAQKGMIGIAMSNADPNMAIPNSRCVAIGNNPFSFAAPRKNGKSLFLDIALSNVAALKIVMAKEKGMRVPKEWLVDSDGRPTDDPSEFPGRSFLQPMALHKGYGLAVMVELLSSVLTGSGLLGEVRSWNLDLGSRNNVGHAFLAIDVSKMLPFELFEERMERLAGELHSAKKAKDADRIYLPGEMEWEKYDAALQRGELRLTDAMEGSLSKLADLLKIDLKWSDEAAEKNFRFQPGCDK